jgi:hypothetical protein
LKENLDWKIITENFEKDFLKLSEK